MAFATIHYSSRSLRKASSFNIVFPEEPATSRPWAAFYLLHGLSDDNTIWTRRTSIERYVAGWPMVVVMPDGGRGFYTNAVAGDAYEDDLTKDVMGLVERTFPVKGTLPDRPDLLTPAPQDDNPTVIDTTKGTVHMIIGGGGHPGFTPVSDSWADISDTSLSIFALASAPPRPVRSAYTAAPRLRSRASPRRLA